MKRACIGVVGMAVAVGSLAGCGGGEGGGGGGPSPAAVARHVAYAARATAGAPTRLYVTDVESGGARPVSGVALTGLDVIDFAWSADHRRLAYRADLDGDGALELYVVTPGVEEEPGRLVSDGHVVLFTWSKAGADLAYVSNEEVAAEQAGYLLRDGASAPLRLTPPALVAGGDVSDALFAPDGERVAFVGNLESAGSYELFTVRLDGTGWVKLSGPLVPGGSAYAPRWSPTSERIAWTADAIQAGRHEGFTNLAAGGDLRQVSGAMVAGGDVSAVTWSGDGTRIAFRGDLLQDGVYELFAADARGLARIRLSGPMPVVGLLTVGDVYEFGWTPDGTRIAYTADQEVDEVLDLYVTDTLVADGATKVSGAHAATGTVQGFSFSPTSDRIAFRGDLVVDGHAEAFTVPVGGGPRTTVSGAIVPNGYVFSASFTSDGARVLFRADVDGTNTFDLFCAPAGGGPRTNLSHLGGPGHVTQEVHVAIGGRVVFVGDLDTTNLDELYAVEPDGSDLVRISAPLGAGGAVLKVAVR